MDLTERERAAISVLFVVVVFIVACAVGNLLFW